MPCRRPFLEDHKLEELPYELLALEAALSVCCRTLDQETSEAETRIGPALERLSQKVNKDDLVEVRNLKSTLNRVLVRVGKVKQVRGPSQVPYAFCARQQRSAIRRHRLCLPLLIASSALQHLIRKSLCRSLKRSWMTTMTCRQELSARRKLDGALKPFLIVWLVQDMYLGRRAEVELAVTAQEAGLSWGPGAGHTEAGSRTD